MDELNNKNLCTERAGVFLFNYDIEFLDYLVLINI